MNMRKAMIAVFVMMALVIPPIANAEVVINNYGTKQGDTEALIRKLQLQLIDLLNQLVKKLVSEQSKTQIQPTVIIKEQKPPEVIVQVVPQPTITTTMPTDTQPSKEVLDINGFFKETDVDHKKVWIDNNSLMPLRVGFYKLSSLTKQGDVKLTVTGEFSDGTTEKIINTPIFGPGKDYNVVFTVPETISGKEYSFRLDVNNDNYTGLYEGKVTRITMNAEAQ